MNKVDLLDPGLFAQVDGGLNELRALQDDHTPYWHPSSESEGFWAITVYTQAVQVLTNSKAFTSQEGINLGQAQQIGQAPAAGKMLVQADTDAHRRLKAILSRYLSPQALVYLADSLPSMAASIVTQASDREQPFDFVKDVSRPLALATLSTLLGVPEGERHDLQVLADGAFDPSDSVADAAQVRIESNSMLFAYFLDILHRPQSSTPGLLGSLHRDRHRLGLSEEEIVLNAHLVLAGAYESTRHALSALGGYYFSESSPNLTSSSQPTEDAIDEILRLASPALNIMRTATRDIDIGGTTVRAGQRVTLWVPILNRDPSRFESPDEVDLQRKDNRHLSFGMSKHFCLGSFLARTELAALWGALQSGPQLRLAPTGTTRVRSLRSWGYESLPVTPVAPNPQRGGSAQ